MKYRLQRVGLLAWAIASLVAAAFITEQHFDRALGESMYLSLIPLAAWYGTMQFRSSLRRRFYGGMMLALVAGIFAVYGLGILRERAVCSYGHDLWTSCLEDYLDREYPGWVYSEDVWPEYHGSSVVEEVGRYRVAASVVGIRHKEDAYWVLGNVHQTSPVGGWLEPIFSIYPIDEGGAIVPELKMVVNWPQSSTEGSQ